MANVVIDQDRYADVAKVWIERVTRQIITSLSQNGAIKVSAQGLSKPHEGLVFDQLFLFFLALESRSALELGDGLYLPGLAFGIFPEGPGVPGPTFMAQTLLGSDRASDLHGGISFDLVQAVAKDVAAGLSN